MSDEQNQTLEALAHAWEEGHSAGFADHTSAAGLTPNPYNHVPLDPEPWVSWGVRYPRQIGVAAYFAPRDGYEKNEQNYAASTFSGRDGYRP